MPDAEDEEEARRSASRAGNNSDASSSGGVRVPLDMNMNLGGDLLSSVITYENQDDRFRALEAKRGGSQGREILTSRRGEKEELDESYQYEQPAPYNASQDVVIVGSDIVLEPLPSAKAAKATISGSGEDQSQGERRDANQPSSSSGKTKLSRHATLGSVLPTIGTEEYLERTDDKEEYSFGLHGDRHSLAESSSAPSSRSAIMHPPTRTELGQAAQGDILEAGAQDTATSPYTVDLLSSSSSSTAAPASAPPLVRSTKPKMSRQL